MPVRLPDLPVLEALPALREALAARGLAVLAAPPGSGKTTVVPLALLDEPWLRGRKILMLEPRRLAARASAARMADLLGEPTGQTVGFQVRFERRTSPQTRVEVITEGLLTRRIQSDPELPGVGLVIFDEFHERSLDVDLALALTLDARAQLNPGMRILVMSATLDSQRVADLLASASGGAPVPVVSASGRLFPVDVRYRPASDSPLDAAVAQAALAAMRESGGDVLAFLPGGREIRGAQRMLQERAGPATRVCPLYGDLSSEEQDAALRPAPAGIRKVILATNIAQTSLTVEGVAIVVDGGFARVARFDRAAGANRLETARISRAAADQRAGRAGRLGPGVCYRLWTLEQHGRLAAHDTPEILSADLSRFALELAAWGAQDAGSLPFLDAPSPADWREARQLLGELGALDAEGRVSAHGRALSRLPTIPRLGHMLLTAKAEGLVATAAWIAAELEDRGSSQALDLETRVETLAGGRGDPAQLHRLRRVAEQFQRLVADARTPLANARIEGAAAGRIVSWAYPERIARRRPGRTGVYLCEDGGEARIPETDALARQEWLAIAHWDPEPPRRVRLAGALTLADVERDHATRIAQIREVRWDAATGAVVAEEQRRLGAIVLGSRSLRESEGEAMRAAMATGVRALGLEALPWTDEARQWQARVLSLRGWRPDDGWPDVSDAALAGSLEDWLQPHLDRITRRDHLARLDLLGILQGMLDYATQQKLARLAPTHLSVPTGSRIRLAYQPPNAPALEVKLQEMFGCRDTPTVNDGRTKVVVHLLSPAKHPLAVTQDLAGFWARGYVDVKKDMKGRYPRHPWPEDPVSAAPTRRAKPRGT